MEEVIEKIVLTAKKLSKDYGYSDQYELLTEASRRLEELGEEALKLEYLMDKLEGGEE